MERGYAPISCPRPARDRRVEGRGPGRGPLSEPRGGDLGMLGQWLWEAETIGSP